MMLFLCTSIAWLVSQPSECLPAGVRGVKLGIMQEDAVVADCSATIAPFGCG